VGINFLSEQIRQLNARPTEKEDYTTLNPSNKLLLVSAD